MRSLTPVRAELPHKAYQHNIWKRSIFLFLFYLLICPHGASALAGFRAAEYFPMRQGNSWTYRIDGSSTGTTTVLSGTVNINGVSTRVLESSFGGKRYFTNDINGVRLHRDSFFTFSDTDATFNPPLKYANTVANIGDTVNGSGTISTTITGIGSGTLSYSATSEIEAEENVSVPSGVFKALRVRTSAIFTGTISGVPINVSTTEINWVAKQVGVVKSVITAGGVTETDELTTASVIPVLANISTRGLVGTGDNVMIGGFIVGGSLPKTILIRGRGPSMGDAPFFVPGTLADPFLKLFSGPTPIAENNNWEDLPSCPGSVCVAASEIIATGMDPCQPNPDQVTSPPGCTLESAIMITLDPGPYTVHLSGSGGATSVGLIEVFEIFD